MHARLYVKLKGGVMFEEEISSILLQRVVLCGLRLGWLGGNIFFIFGDYSGQAYSNHSIKHTDRLST